MRPDAFAIEATTSISDVQPDERAVVTELRQPVDVAERVPLLCGREHLAVQREPRLALPAEPSTEFSGQL